MGRESWFSNKRIMYQLFSRFAENSIMYICFPYIEYFGSNIVFEKKNVCNDIEHSTFVHPIR